MRIRDATAADAAACAAIYAPYVSETAISFETEPPPAEAMAARIERAARHHAWLVAEADARVVAYAYAGAHIPRAAYRWTCEVSVYVARGHTGRGAGRALYEALFDRLAARGFRVALAGMTEPNAASAALHRALGFTPVGTYRRVGFKDGAWHDVTWLQRSLGDSGDPPAEPR